jgi:hypothetical protein
MEKHELSRTDPHCYFSTAFFHQSFNEDGTLEFCVGILNLITLTERQCPPSAPAQYSGFQPNVRTQYPKHHPFSNNFQLLHQQDTIPLSQNNLVH